MRPEQISNCSAMLLIKRSHQNKWLLTSSPFSLLMWISVAIVSVATLHVPQTTGQRDLSTTKATTIYPAEITKNKIATEYEESSLCITPGCIKIAAEYLKRANLSADPCENFYNFACGNYEANTAIPDDETEKTTFRATEDILNDRLKIMLESPSNGNESKSFVKARDFYKACINKTEINNLKERPLKDLLRQLGGWPVVEGRRWSSEAGKNYSWAGTVLALRKIGVLNDFLLDLSVTDDSINSSTYVIEVDEPTFGMPSRDYLLKGINNTLVQKYLKLMVKTAVLLGADRQTAETELADAVQFEIKLANFTLPEEEKRNETKLYNKMTLRELQRLAPIVNWVEFANGLLMDKVNENETVIVISPSYLVNLTKLLMETPKRTVANYAMWRVAMSVSDMLDYRFRSDLLEFASFITGQTTFRPRWKICVTATTEMFGTAIGAMYVRRYFDKNARDAAKIMVRDIRQEFLYILKKIDWMDPITLQRAINKAIAMEEMIAYPMELLNDTIVDDFYRNFTVKQNRFFDSCLQLDRQWSDYQYAKLREIRKRPDWQDVSEVAIVNAYYDPDQNLILFPAGILHGLFFGNDRPRYVNYGSIGSIIGHEITHGFDDEGRQFDEVGNLKQWWEPETDLKFQNKIKCIIDQYSHYNMTSVNMTVNGINTQGENIADNGGVKLAHQAYEKWVANNGEEKPLPGLNLNTRQLFWLSFANVWCSKSKPENEIYHILTDFHSPEKFRVNGVVSNSPQFAADFKCPIRSPMNPVDKCIIW